MNKLLRVTKMFSLLKTNFVVDWKLLNKFYWINFFPPQNSSSNFSLKLFSPKLFCDRRKNFTHKLSHPQIFSRTETSNSSQTSHPQIFFKLKFSTRHKYFLNWNFRSSRTSHSQIFLELKLLTHETFLRHELFHPQIFSPTKISFTTFVTSLKTFHSRNFLRPTKLLTHKYFSLANFSRTETSLRKIKFTSSTSKTSAVTNFSPHKI